MIPSDPASSAVLSDEVRWLDAAEVTLGRTTFAVEDALGFALRDPDGAQLGVALVGEVRTTVPLGSDGEALAVAHQPGASVDGRAWSVAGDVLLVWDPDPALAAKLAAGQVLEQQQGTLGWLDPDGHWNLLVAAVDPDRDRRRAEAVLRDELRALDGLGLSMPRLREGGADRRLAVLATDTRWDGLLAPALGAPTDEHLVFVRDPTGAIDPSHDEAVLVHGLGQDGAPRSRRFGTAPAGAHTRVGSGAVNVVVTRGVGVVHDVAFRARLRLAPGAAGPLVLDLPQRELVDLSGLVQGPPSLELRGAWVDGSPVTRVPGGFSGAPTAGARWTLPLPEAGWTAATVDLEWVETWPAANLLDVADWLPYEGDRVDACLEPLPACPRTLAPVGEPPATLDLGAVAAQRPVLPVIAGQPGSWPADVRVGTTLPGAWIAAIGGAPPERTEAGDGRWWRNREATSRSRVSFGQLEEEVAAPVGLLPGVRVLTHHSDANVGSPSFVRQVVAFFAPVLPAWPVREVVVVEEPRIPVAVDLLAGLAAHDGRAHDGLRGLTHVPVRLDGVAMTLPPHPRHALEHELVSAVLSDAWIDLPFAPEDAWLRVALPELYRDLFARYAWGGEEAERFDDERRAARARRPARLPLDGEVQEVGRSVLAALVDRVGEPAFLAAVDRFTRREQPSVAALREELAATSAVDVGPFFDAWVVAGVSPRLQGTFVVDGPRVEVDLRADPPLGVLDVPVTVSDGRRSETVWVRVEDGVGSARAAPGWRVETAVVDGLDWLPLEPERLERR